MTKRRTSRNTSSVVIGQPETQPFSQGGSKPSANSTLIGSGNAERMTGSGWARRIASIAAWSNTTSLELIFTQIPRSLPSRLTEKTKSSMSKRCAGAGFCGGVPGAPGAVGAAAGCAAPFDAAAFAADERSARVCFAANAGDDTAALAASITIAVFRQSKAPHADVGPRSLYRLRSCTNARRLRKNPQPSALRKPQSLTLS